ncbi:DEDD exonuclease domain-containing protein [Euzebya tangerina]|uniref:DEDD exonuclease domain-containing protein n=1 Tax=Euzebya tangerina TaxID=591198 RepID=UPI000E31E3F9|nr:DEDD exonuclease domain-containing protein [Euzebya tangerina]
MFQPSLDELGQPLSETTFVVVDLETTGGSPEHDRITEVGAVKIRGGELIGELATLVDPGRSVPAEITVLTGISDQLVEGRPGIETVLPSFLEFARGAALVAHNARFDVGFLNAALQRLDYPRLDHPVVCTAQLARRVVGDETRNRRLGTLAHLFRSSTVPNHRALADARATVDVFHAMLERAGTFGVVTLEDLVEFSKVRNMPVFSSRRKMADDLPRRPGTYQFISAAGEVLYVGKATDLRARVRQYFGTDTRPRMAQLVKESKRIEHIVTPTAIEAEIREARLIREHLPRFNRRGKTVRKPVWLTLTGGAYPRLSIARTPPRHGRPAMGPLPSRRVAEEIADAIHDAVPIRRCSTAMKADTRFDACALAEMGRCVAPCVGQVDPTGYGPAADAAAAVLAGDPAACVAVLTRRMEQQSARGRFEEAARTRTRLKVLLDWTTRVRRDLALIRVGVLAASRPAGSGADDTRREVLVQRHGWVVGTSVVAAQQVSGEIDALTRRVDLAPSEARVLPPEELAALQRWLAAPGVLLERSEAGFAWPITGAHVVASSTHAITVAERDRSRRRRLERKQLSRQ